MDTTTATNAAPAEIQQARRAFVRAKTNHFGKFLSGDEGLLVRWGRLYRCDCGFHCTTPGEIFDHSLACKAVR